MPAMRTSPSRPGRSILFAAFALADTVSVAQADVAISSKPTENMTCSGGVCTATAPKAVLNVGDLANMLGSGDVAVKTGAVAKDIEVKQALSWTSTSRLTLDAQQSVTIDKPMTVAGTGALTITTNDGGKHGEFVVEPKASVQFWDLSSSLVIDGNSYTLVGDIKTLAADVAANRSGFYALANDYDASADGRIHGWRFETSRLRTEFLYARRVTSRFFCGIRRLNPNFRTTPTPLGKIPRMDSKPDRMGRGYPLQNMRFEWVAPRGRSGQPRQSKTKIKLLGFWAGGVNRWRRMEKRYTASCALARNVRRRRN